MGSKREVDDRFKKFGTVSFTAITKTNDFIDHLEKGQVMGTRCNDCGMLFSRQEQIATSVYPAISNGLKSPVRANW